MKIIQHSPLWFGLSGLLIAGAIAVFTMNTFLTGSFLRFGIDFTGGTLIEIEFAENVPSLDTVQTSFLQFAEYTPSIQKADDNGFIIKLKNISNETHDEIIDTLKTNLGDFEEIRFITIGPSVGESMKQKAYIALAVALVAIVLYIAFAFREIPKELSAWKFGITAIIALLHDVIITVGIFAVLGLFLGTEIDILFITALLTVMGFSVHDTIVVLDRLRENAKFARPTEVFGETAEKSVQQTITRSINTSLSTLFPLIALYFFGSGSIQMFVLALIIGVIIGTYSSIFIATPVLVAWQGANKSKDE